MQYSHRALVAPQLYSVSARADTGSEVKQHGGAFFAKTMSTPQLHSHSATGLDTMDDVSQMSQESQDPATPGGNSSSTNGNNAMRCLDAADTEHILLSCPLMWRNSSDRNIQAQLWPAQGISPPSAAHQMAAAASSNIFSRAVARSPLEASSAPQAGGHWLSPTSRFSEEGLNHSPVDRMCAKRTRSGLSLSVRLPSLVELPGAEARCAAQDISHAGSAPAYHVAMVDLATARAAHAGLSQFSLSSPGDTLGAANSAGNHAEEAGKGGQVSAGESLAIAIAATKFSTPVLTRIRQSVTCGKRDTQSSAELTPSAANDMEQVATVRAPEGSSRVSDQKQRGGRKVLQLLESTQESMRSKWHQQLLCERTSSLREPPRKNHAGARFQSSACAFPKPGNCVYSVHIVTLPSLHGVLPCSTLPVVRKLQDTDVESFQSRTAALSRHSARYCR